MYGRIAEAVGLFMDMEAMIGGDFEKGLAALKRLAEQSQLGQKKAAALSGAS